MGQPRRLSRPDRPAGDSYPRVKRCQRAISPERACRIYLSEGDRIDPGRVIETAFRGRCHADDPETYALAWLALLGASTDAPGAAARLSARLMRYRVGRLSAWQRRMLELLGFIARHRSHIKPLPKKGTS
jgi:hypothetical protein